MAINNVQNLVQVSQSDLFTGVKGRADVIVANIVADIVIKLLPDLPAKLKVNGVFIASGIITERLSDVTTAMLAQDLVIDKVIEEGGWVAIVARMGGI